MVKNIFFDFNGTLLDDVKLCYDIESNIVSAYNLKPISLSFYLDNFCFPVKKYYEKIGFDFNKVSYKDVSKMFFDEYLAREKEETQLYPNVKETLTYLKEKGIKLYCFSASERTLLHNQLQFLGIFDFFDGIIASDNIAAKGKLDYGREYIEKHHIEVESTLMIGDTYHDYEVAKDLGLTPILVTFGHNSENVLKTLNVALIKNFSDIKNLI